MLSDYAKQRFSDDLDKALRPAKERALAAMALYETARLELDAARASYLADIAIIEARMAEATRELQATVTGLEAQLRSEVKEAGESVRGQYYRASYVKPQTKVAIERLLGYALAHPEVAEMLSEGAPTVRIEAIK